MGATNSRMGAPGTWDKSNTPFAWNPKTAITFCDAVNLIDVFLDPGVPISREMVALFFFHESGFSVIDQAGGGPGFQRGRRRQARPMDDRRQERSPPVPFERNKVQRLPHPGCGRARISL